ncbi:glycoside hydrolase superfamily, partial [Blyttiomyces helicus]
MNPILSFLLLALATTAAAAPTTPAPKKVVYWMGEGDPANLPWTLFTHINYAFGIPATNGAIDVDTSKVRFYYLVPGFPALAKLAKQHSVKVGISVGGWDNSDHFSKLVANSGAIDTFARSANALLEEFGLDGIDIDWEYPGEAGATTNFDAQNDTPNYLRFLKALRAAIGPNKYISAAVAENLFEVNGNPTTDLSAFAAIFDWVSPMVYDNFGPWVSETAHDAPMSAFTAAATLWHSAGFAKSQIVLGYPLYGRIADLNFGTAGLNLPILKFEFVNGDTGFTYDELQAKFSSGWTRHWDASELSAWWGKAIYGHFATVPDPEAAQARAQWVLENGYGGIMLWEVTQDSNHVILSALNTVLQTPPSLPIITPPKSTSTTARPTSTPTSVPHAIAGPKRIVYWLGGGAPEDLPWTSITHLNYASLAKQHSVKVALAVGGWAGSAEFSKIAASEAATNTFAASVKSILTTFGFD